MSTFTLESLSLNLILFMLILECNYEVYKVQPIFNKWEVILTHLQIIQSPYFSDSTPPLWT